MRCASNLAVLLKLWSQQGNSTLIISSWYCIVMHVWQRRALAKRFVEFDVLTMALFVMFDGASVDMRAVSASFSGSPSVTSSQTSSSSQSSSFTASISLTGSTSATASTSSSFGFTASRSVTVTATPTASATTTRSATGKSLSQ